ncbi:FAD dependent oxidoreductase [Podospora didyma]|uniref:FAD dependent oxidoreductase n=1 Tax=Podospora didyma TaxID=330526 RepID=A0AAE0K589_9PEZI|nr:FAD dependent oxidoreductase [Podospora didyma]
MVVFMTDDEESMVTGKKKKRKELGHRTTAALPETADVVIVGSGITGAFAARFLKQRHAESGGGGGGGSVVVLEAREACAGATGRNGGHCQPLLYAATPAIAEFELETFRFLRDLVKEHDIPCDWVILSGGVHAFLSKDIFDLASKGVAQLEKHHPELAAQVKVVSPSSSSPSSGVKTKDATTLASLRVPDVPGAILQRNAASLWPYKLVAWVLEDLLRRFPNAEAFNLQTNTPVTAIQRQQRQRDGPGNSITYPWVLTTPRGRIAARQVLLATNGYTSRLLPAFADLIVPVRGQIGALLPSSSSSGSGVVPKLDHSYVFIKNGSASSWREDYLVQRPLSSDGGGGHLIFGGGRSRARNQGVGEWRDDEVEPPVAKFLRTNLSPRPLDLQPTTTPDDSSTSSESRTRSEGGGDLEASFEWTGVMGFSRDHHAWVGAVPESLGGGDGLYMCAGYSGHGMPAAALSARAVVEQMVIGSEGGGDQGQKSVVGDVRKIPDEFVLSEERVRRARDYLETIQEAEAKGLAGLFPELVAAAAGGVEE